MKLYYMPNACPLASHIALNWAKLPYELQPVSRDELKQPAYLSLNPMGSVPVLVDGDLTLTQSAAILEYIAESSPETALLPDTMKDRAEVRRWLGFINADIHKTFGNIFGAAYFSSTPEGQKELVEKSTAKLLQMFGIVDKQLEGKDWLAGSRSIADPYLYTVMRWANAKGVDLSKLNNLQGFYARMEADPSVQKSLKEQGLG